MLEFSSVLLIIVSKLTVIIIIKVILNSSTPIHNYSKIIITPVQTGGVLVLNVETLLIAITPRPYNIKYNYYWLILSEINGKENFIVLCPLLQPPLYGISYSQPVGVSKNLQLRTINTIVSISCVHSIYK